MHELGSQGVLTGTAQQLSRIGRCSDGEIVHALSELSTCKAADISERSGVYTVINRRMKRESDLGKVRSDSGAKAIAKRKQNAEDEIEVEIESSEWLKTPEGRKLLQDWDDHRDAIQKPNTSIAKLQQIRFLKSIGETRAISAVNYSIRNGWQGIFEERNGAVKNHPPAIPVWRQIQIIEEDIETHPANPDFRGFNRDTVTPDQREHLKLKRQKLAELKAQQSSLI